jgi:hypothetical protein
MGNHLVVMSGTVDGQAVTASLVYDVLGRLAQTTINAGTSITTQLHYDGDALIGEYVGSMHTTFADPPNCLSPELQAVDPLAHLTPPSRSLHRSEVSGNLRSGQNDT